MAYNLKAKIFTTDGWKTANESDIPQRFWLITNGMDLCYQIMGDENKRRLLIANGDTVFQTLRRGARHAMTMLQEDPEKYHVEMDKLNDAIGEEHVKSMWSFVVEFLLQNPGKVKERQISELLTSLFELTEGKRWKAILDDIEDVPSRFYELASTQGQPTGGNRHTSRAPAPKALKARFTNSRRTERSKVWEFWEERKSKPMMLKKFTRSLSPSPGGRRDGEDSRIMASTHKKYTIPSLKDRIDPLEFDTESLPALSGDNKGDTLEDNTLHRDLDTAQRNTTLNEEQKRKITEQISQELLAQRNTIHMNETMGAKTSLRSDTSTYHAHQKNASQGRVIELLDTPRKTIETPKGIVVGFSDVPPQKNTVALMPGKEQHAHNVGISKVLERISDYASNRNSGQERPNRGGKISKNKPEKKKSSIRGSSKIWVKKYTGEELTTSTTEKSNASDKNTLSSHASEATFDPPPRSPATKTEKRVALASGHKAEERVSFQSADISDEMSWLDARPSQLDVLPVDIHLESTNRVSAGSEQYSWLSGSTSDVKPQADTQGKNDNIKGIIGTEDEQNSDEYNYYNPTY